MLTQIMVEQKRSAEAGRDGKNGFAYAMSGLCGETGYLRNAG